MTPFEELARIDEQITGEPTPYILPAQPGAWMMPVGADAYCITVPTALMRDHLIDAGLWRGYRPLIVFDGFTGTSKSLGTYLHERAHCIPTPSQPADEPVDDGLRAVQDFQLLMLSLTPLAEDAPLWSDHDANFIRRCLHLHARAVSAGWAVCWRELQIAGRLYGLSDVELYVEALGDEAWRMRDASFSEIEATPMPTAFAELWANDTAPRTSR